MALRIDSSQNRNLYVGTGTEVAVNDGNAIVTGKVGIGTTSPSTTLQLTKANTEVLANNPAWPAGILEITDTSTYNAGTGATIVFRKKRDSTGNQVTVGAIAGEGVAGDSRLSFWTGTAAYMGTAPKMVIDDSGNVGIGTTSPAAKLDVRGSAGGYLKFDTTGSNSTIKSDYNLQLYADDTGDNSSPFANMQFFTAGANERMRINAAGNVGIGVTGPATKLEVSSSLTSGIKVTNSGTINGEAGIEAYHTGAQTGTAYAGYITKTGAGGTNVGIYTAASGATNNYGLIVGSGNVGIGTTSPQQLLHISNTSGGFGAEAVLRGSTSTGIPKSEIAFKRFTSGDGAEIVLRTSNSGGTLQHVMTLATSGNVGIGVANPETSRLLVRGSTNDSTSQIFQAANLAGNTRYAIRPDGDNKWYKSDSSLSMTITSAGNVGINVTSPGVKLQLVSADEQLTNFSSSVANQLAYSQINASSSTSGTITAAAALELVGKANASGHGRHAWIGAEGTPNTNTKTKLKFKIRGETASGYDWAGAAEAPTIMTLEGDGNVGIGETTPNCKLDVKGVVNTTIIAATTLGDGGGAANRGLAIRTLIDGGEITTVGSSTNMYLDTGNNLYLQNAGNTKVTMLANGNVGIGTTNPTSKLVVGDLANTSGALNDIFVTGDKVNFDGYYARLIFGNSSQSGGSTASIRGERKTDNYGTELTFYTNTNGSSGSGTERMRIGDSGAIKFNAYNSTNNTGTPTYVLGTDASGNVVKVLGGDIPGGGGTVTGTGTTGRLTKFTDGANGVIGDSILAVTADSLDFTNTDFAQIKFKESGAIIIDSDDDQSSRNFQIKDGSGSSLLTVLDTGNVGIGTTSPTQKLHLDGNNYNTATRTTFLIRDVGNNYDQGDNAIDIVMRSRYWSGDQNTSQNSKIRHLKDNSNGSTGTQLRFSTTTRGAGDSSDKMTILASGNVGIGTTSPGHILDVTTSNSATWAVALKNTNATGYGLFVQGSETTNRAILAAYSGSSYKLWVRGDGNVGIGTTSPAQKLHVGDGGIRVEKSATGLGGFISVGNATELAGNYSAYFFGNTASDTGYFKGGIAYETLASTYGRGDMHFLQNSTTAVANVTISDSVMTILNGGNVGIGTTSPVSELHISKSKTGNVAISVQNTNASYSSQIRFLNSVGTERSAITFVPSDISLRFFHNGGDRMFINSSGNVGIGTTSPGSKLQVAGEIRVADGNKGTPSYTFTSDTNTGMYSDTADVIDFTAGGTKSLSVTTSGATVYGSALMPSNAAILLQNQNNNNQFYIRNSGVSDATFQVGQGAPGSNVRFFINGSGNVGIGNTASTASVKLEVTGNTLLKNSNGVGDLYLGNYATANHFRFHTNNANTYFDMNCGDIYWRQGTSTRYQFFPSTANMTVQGTITQNSDARIKENVVEISDCISKVQAMRGVYYNRTDFNTDVTKVGVIAQEVEAVLPELVLESPETGLKSVAYSELTSVLINAIKEQQEIIEDLKTRITKLEN